MHPLKFKLRKPYKCPSREHCILTHSIYWILHNPELCKRTWRPWTFWDGDFFLSKGAYFVCVCYFVLFLQLKCSKRKCFEQNAWFIKWHYKHLKMHTTKLIKVINYTIKYIYFFTFILREHWTLQHQLHIQKCKRNEWGGGVFFVYLFVWFLKCEMP